jgi:hypothetical protein
MGGLFGVPPPFLARRRQLGAALSRLRWPWKRCAVASDASRSRTAVGMVVPPEGVAITGHSWGV